jgi:NAD(P)H dehydrogenase (quinone)
VALSSETPHIGVEVDRGSSAKLLGKPVRMKVVPRESWDALFRSQGMQNPVPRIQMLDGFNEGWIEFESGEAGSQKGITSLDSVLKLLIQTSSG